MGPEYAETTEAVLVAQLHTANQDLKRLLTSFRELGGFMSRSPEVHRLWADVQNTVRHINHLSGRLGSVA